MKLNIFKIKAYSVLNGLKEAKNNIESGISDQIMTNEFVAKVKNDADINCAKTSKQCSELANQWKKDAKNFKKVSEAF